MDTCMQFEIVYTKVGLFYIIAWFLFKNIIYLK